MRKPRAARTATVEPQNGLPVPSTMSGQRAPEFPRSFCWRCFWRGHFWSEWTKRDDLAKPGFSLRQLNQYPACLRCGAPNPSADRKGSAICPDALAKQLPPLIPKEVKR